MSLWDIVAYSYRADVFCPPCTAERVEEDRGVLDDGIMFPTTEGYLNHVADLMGLERHDEQSFDSIEFPKVVFRDQMEGAGACSRCGGPIVGAWS